MIHHHAAGSVYSIDRVRNELLVGRKTDELVQWVTDLVPASFFLDVDQEEVVNVYTDVMLWAQRSGQFHDHAKAKFATGADGWIVAYAHANAAIVVTNEAPAPESKSSIKLPDVCDQFDVAYLDTFAMLRDLSIQFGWRGAS